MINTPNWVKDAVFYQIFPDRFAKSDQLAKPTNIQPWGAEPTYHNFFGGDLLGVVERLDHLAELGINALYLNPIFASAANHRYHTNDYYTIDPLLGGNSAFKTLLDEAHNRGMRVILDGVFNHCGRGLHQFNSLMENHDQSPYLDWFHIHNFPIRAFIADHESPNYDAWWGLAALPKFKTDTPAVREFLLDVATYWLEQGIDGWRLDVPNEIDDDAFWQEFRTRCRAVNPDAYIVGEIWGDASRWLQGDQFDAVMNYLFAKPAFGFFCGDNFNRHEGDKTDYKHVETLNGHRFAEALDHIFNGIYAKEIVDVQMNMLGSHDTPRLLTLANEDLKAISQLFLCQLTVPGAPNIYYGDEIGLAGGHDPFNRGCFPWDDAAQWQPELFTQVKQFVQLRHDHVSLRRGDFRVLFADERVLVYQRVYEAETAIIAFNVSHENKTITLENAPSLPEKLTAHSTFLTNQIDLPPQSSRVWIS